MADNSLKDRVEALEYDFQVVSDKLDDLKDQVEALPAAILGQTRKMIQSGNERVIARLERKMDAMESRLLAAIKESGDD